MRHVGTPGLEVGLCQLEYFESQVLSLRSLIRQFPIIFLVQFFNDPADSLFGDVGNGWVVLPTCRFWKLNQNELSVATVLVI